MKCSVTSGKERASVPVSDFSGGIGAMGVLDLVGWTMLRARGRIAAPVVSPVDDYSLSFI